MLKLRKLGLLLLFMILVFTFGCGKKNTTEISNNTNTQTVEETETTSEESVEEVSLENTTIAVEATTVLETTTVAFSTASATGTAKTTTTIKSVSTPNTSTKTTPTEQNKIIATSAAICDIMDRLDIDLIGVPETSVSTILSRYSNVTRVGSPMEPDMEIIKSLKPTDVITPDTLKEDLKIKYDNIGVNSTFVNLRSVQGLYDTVKIIGDKYDKSSEAKALISEYNSFINSYSSGNEGKSKPKVLVLMGLPGSYLVATNNSYAGSLVELAGGINVFKDSTNDFINVNTEEILAKDPDVIIRTAHGLPKEAQAMFQKEFSTNDIWKHFKAVQNGKVYDVDYTLFGMSATFDYPKALADLKPMLYGD